MSQPQAHSINPPVVNNLPNPPPSHVPSLTTRTAQVIPPTTLVDKISFLEEQLYSIEVLCNAFWDGFQLYPHSKPYFSCHTGLVAPNNKGLKVHIPRGAVMINVNEKIYYSASIGPYRSVVEQRAFIEECLQFVMESFQLLLPASKPSDAVHQNTMETYDNKTVNKLASLELKIERIWKKLEDAFPDKTRPNESLKSKAKQNGNKNGIDKKVEGECSTRDPDHPVCCSII